jgi:hypothetical protein
MYCIIRNLQVLEKNDHSGDNYFAYQLYKI